MASKGAKIFRVMIELEGVTGLIRKEFFVTSKKSLSRVVSKAKEMNYRVRYYKEVELCTYTEVYDRVNRMRGEVGIKTNLFKDDRVRLSKFGLARLQPTRRERTCVTKESLGTIVSDTLDPNVTHIKVRWDGFKQVYSNHRYLPEELELFEEEESVAA